MIFPIDRDDNAEKAADFRHGSSDGIREAGDSPDFSGRYGTWAGSGLLGAEAEKNKAEQADPEEHASAQCGYPDLTSLFARNFVFAYI